MKRYIIIISAILFLTGATELHQLLRIPVLVEHYFHHRSEDQSLTLVGFLKLHYSNNHPDDRDDNDDNKLPFKSQATISHIDTSVPVTGETNINTVFYLLEKVKINHPEGIPTHITFSIFHPPRLI